LYIVSKKIHSYIVSDIRILYTAILIDDYVRWISIFKWFELWKKYRL